MKEYLDIVDKEGNPTGKIVERKIAHALGIMHRTSHVWFLRKKDDHIQLLLHKRAQCKDAYPGCYDISSAGHIPTRSEFVSSAIREVHEELGVDITEAELICCGNRYVKKDAIFHDLPFHDRQYSRVFVVWKDPTHFVLQKEEVESVIWMNIEDVHRCIEEHTFAHCIALEEIVMIEKYLQGMGKYEC